MNYSSLLAAAGVEAQALGASGGLLAATPINGATLGHVQTDSAPRIEEKIAAASAAFTAWRGVPGPQRGELVRQFGTLVRAHKSALAQLITLEAGKIASEGLGEVQEVIDICEYAVGLSRQLHGLTLPSERAGHHLLERWQPLGPVGIISAFNFPMAVWAWNASLALVCGDSILWKPSEKTPLCGIALHRLLEQVIAANEFAPRGLSQLIIGGRDAGAQLAAHSALPLISATGSTAMGRTVAQVVAARFGRSLLELGGNNAAVVTASADLALTLRAVVFAAAGTSGQRCTSLRRLFVQRAVYAQLVPQLRRVYATLSIGDPLSADTLMGPLIDAEAFNRMQAALVQARTAGATVHGGERVFPTDLDGGYYVRPALVELQSPIEVMQQETFAPILYVLPYERLDQAIAAQNAVRQGLSSAIFSNDLRETETFLSAAGSDCGIANVNCGTSGAEIGGAFGGEKETGGGREAGSDCWKAYMRRQTQSVNYSGALPLAQGVRFDIG